MRHSCVKAFFVLAVLMWVKANNRVCGSEAHGSRSAHQHVGQTSFTVTQVYVVQCTGHVCVNKALRFKHYKRV